MPSTILKAIVLSLFAVAPTLVAANGCFTGGEAYASVGTDDEINAAIVTACTALATSYTGDQELSTCIDFPDTGNRINFAVANQLGSDQTLSETDCQAAMTIEKNACSMGSIQVHGTFLYTDDPNAGAC